MHAIDTNLIVALRALLQERNVTRAAKAVGLGQSSMSHALARLRVHFGDPLLVQVGRNMVLTERAKGLLGAVEQAVENLEKVFIQSERFDPRTSARVFKVAAPDNLEFYVLPRVTRAPGERSAESLGTCSPSLTGLDTGAAQRGRRSQVGSQVQAAFGSSESGSVRGAVHLRGQQGSSDARPAVSI